MGVPTKLSGSGNVRFNTRFNFTATMRMTGNVNLSLDGFSDGETAYLYVTQDQVGGRALFINPVPGTTNQINSTAGISTAPNVSTEVKITRINGVYYILYNRLDGSAGSGGGGGTAPTTGTVTRSGNSTATEYTFPHGIGDGVQIPSYVNVQAGSADAANIAYVTINSTNITVYYEVAPPTGTNNLIFNWSAKL